MSTSLTDDLIDEFMRLIPADRVISDPDRLQTYNHEWRRNFKGDARIVLRPQSTTEVSTILKFCFERKIDWKVVGGNTGLVGGAVASATEVLISLESMTAIRNVNPQSFTMIVEAGLTLASTRAAAAAAGRLFPSMLASAESCTIGGNVSTNAGGMQVLRYGMTRDLVLGLEVVLPDGSIISDLRGLRKANLGLDWKQLFIGTEGEYGIITAVCLKLYPQPRESVACFMALPDVATAPEVLARLKQDLGERISLFELMNEESVSMVVEVAIQSHKTHLRHPIGVDSRRGYYGLLLVESAEASGVLEGEVMAVGAELIAQGLVVDLVLAQSMAQADHLIKLREGVSEAQSQFGPSVKHDISLPLNRIAEFLHSCNPMVSAKIPGLRIVAFGHIGDGNIHYNLTKPAAMDRDEFDAMQPEISRMVYDLVMELGGSFSAEHGIGKLRRDEFVRYSSPAVVALVDRVKQSIRLAR